MDLSMISGVIEVDRWLGADLQSYTDWEKYRTQIWMWFRYWTLGKTFFIAKAIQIWTKK